jgi:phosphonate transport system substrate-binding protein
MNMRFTKMVLAAAMVGSMALSTVAVKAEEEITELTFGIIPTDSIDNLKKGFEPFAADLSKKMGIKINTQYGQDYASVIEAMRFKKVDFAWFGNKSAIEACNRADAEVFAQLVGLDGAPGYWSLIIVHKDSPYNSIEDIIKDGKDLVFGNGDPNSTSGYLIPTYYIWAKKGINPNDLFKEVRNASHGANNLAVANKQVDFATNNTSAQRRFQKSNPDLAKNIKIIWQSPLIPNDPICWRKDLPQEVQNKLKAAFLSYGRIGPEAKKEREILAGISSGWAPFNNSDNRQLVPIRQLNLVKDKKKIQANEDLSDDEKAKRVAELDEKLEGLKTYFELMQQY